MLLLIKDASLVILLTGEEKILWIIKFHAALENPSVFQKEKRNLRRSKHEIFHTDAGFRILSVSCIEFLCSCTYITLLTNIFLTSLGYKITPKTGEMVQNERFGKRRQTSKLTCVKGHADQVIW